MNFDPIKWIIDREEAAIERKLQQIADGTYKESVLERVADHPAGFLALLIGGCFAALGVAEVLCILLGVPFDQRIG